MFRRVSATPNGKWFVTNRVKTLHFQPDAKWVNYFDGQPGNQIVNTRSATCFLKGSLINRPLLVYKSSHSRWKKFIGKSPNLTVNSGNAAPGCDIVTFAYADLCQLRYQSECRALKPWISGNVLVKNTNKSEIITADLSYRFLHLLSSGLRRPRQLTQVVSCRG
jgi:hypothetical protein